MIQKFIQIKAIQTSEKELIPIWDERICYEKTELYGNVIRLKNDYNHYQPIDCVFNLKTKKVELGIEVDIYPDEKDLQYKKGERILYEVEHRKLSIANISKIVYDDYDLVIKKGSRIDKYYLKNINIDIDKNSIYALKIWKPYYILNNGVKIDYEFKLYKFLQ